ncbi:MAG: FkbM family methyltransferase [Coleofasciculus sp. B1-GNL1-01]|uniref:FkbM family methyltransferase n=1 Tax=Coleofasciculus sp. B1-GNL1-01 TaxID=3068484 RepID=UPI0032F64183
MTLLPKLARRLQILAYIIEKPKLLALVLQGGSVNKFISLDQPWLHELKIETVLDIGAHAGISAVTIHSLFPKAQIYSFEPLPICFQQLQMRMAGVNNFKGFNIALGDCLSNLPLDCNSFTPSSSFLKMTDLHKTEFPYTRHSQPLSVKVERLDTIAEQIPIIDPLWIKIDVQGYEEKVLRGGEKTIQRAKLIIVETSFKKLYEGQPLFDNIYNHLIKLGFDYFGSLDQLRSRKNGQVLQEDSIFMKNA